MRKLLPQEVARAGKLLPQVQAALFRLRVACGMRGVGTFVGATYRTEAEQAMLVKAGRSRTMRSWHLLRRAVDLYVLDAKGKPDLAGKLTDRWQIMWKLAEREGWRVLARHSAWAARNDRAHIEYREGMTYARAKLRSTTSENASGTASGSSRRSRSSACRVRDPVPPRS